MIFKFKLGDLKLTVISDGDFPVTKEFFFANTPEKLTKSFPSKFNAPLNFLLIETNHKKILVDAGLGTSHQPVSGFLVERLKTDGVNLEDIDTIIITHAHQDHIGGLTFDGIPVFPNAEHIMSHHEWVYWESQPKSEIFKQLSLLKESLVFVNSDIEISSGVQVIHTPGHTPGHLAVKIKSNEKSLFIASDILNDPQTLAHLPSHILAEISPKQGLETRKTLLRDAYDESAIIFACHYPFPGLGRVVKKMDGWQWIPYKA